MGAFGSRGVSKFCVPGGQMPPGQQDGPPERIARLAFSLQETTSAIPVVVRRAADASSFGFGRGPDAAGTDVAAVRGVTSMGESTAVGPQALLLAPLFTLRTELSRPRSPTHTPSSPSAPSSFPSPSASPPASPHSHPPSSPTPSTASSASASASSPTHHRPAATLPPPPPVARIDAAGLSLPGFAPGYKDRNQDAALLLDTFLSNRQHLVAVMDGHGPEGHRVSEFVRRNLPYTLLSNLVAEAESGAGMDAGKEAEGKHGVGDVERGNGAGVAGGGGAGARAGKGGEGEEVDGGGPLRRALRRAVTALDEHLAGSGIDDVNSGTTAALCHVHGRRLTAAWVGDSRMVLGLPLGRDSSTNTNTKPNANSTANRNSGNNKEVEELDSGGKGPGGGWRVAWSSQDHKPEAPEESARIAAAGGRVARSVSRNGPVGPYRVWFAGADYPGLAMSRALGDRPGRQIGITCAPSCAEVLLPSDRTPAVLVVASDGVWELLDNAEVVRLAATAGSASEAASALVHKSRRAWVKEYGGSYVDDITALVVRINMPPSGLGPS